MSRLGHAGLAQLKLCEGEEAGTLPRLKFPNFEETIPSMISGVHLIIYSKDAEADKVFFRDVLKLTHIDVGDGWLIFGLPPTELAVHPSSENGQHEIYLMCDNVNVFVEQMATHQIKCSKIQDRGWGQLVQLTLPGGGKLGVYEPRHARPNQ